MGNSCQNINELNSIFPKLYNLYKQMIINLKDINKDTLNDIYLISVKSIPNFIKPIEKSNILKIIKEGIYWKKIKKRESKLSIRKKN